MGGVTVAARPVSPKLAHVGLDGGNESAVADRLRNRLDVRRERPVVGEARRQVSNRIARGPRADTRLERSQELDRLSAREQFDREGTLGIPQHLPALQT